jgi:hypothetical protein
MYSGMNEVTSKVAYAYAKQQAFVYLGLILLIATTGVEYLHRPNPFVFGANTPAPAWIDLGSSILLVAGSLLVLGIAFTRKNLEAVTRPSLRVVALMLGVELVSIVGSGVVTHGTGPGVAEDLALLLSLGLGVLSYPLPVRRGSAVLYSPAEVQTLSNSRSLGLGAGILALVALLRLVSPGGSIGVEGGPVSASITTVLVLALSILAAAFFVLLPRGSRRPKAVGGVLAAAVIVALLPLLADPWDLTRWAVASLPLSVGLAALIVVGGLSRVLNRGKTIVSHRA